MSFFDLSKRITRNFKMRHPNAKDPCFNVCSPGWPKPSAYPSELVVRVEIRGKTGNRLTINRFAGMEKISQHIRLRGKMKMQTATNHATTTHHLQTTVAIIP